MIFRRSTTEPGPRRDIRALRVRLIVNPYSSSLTARREQLIIKTLASSVELTIARTQRANHATELAREAREEGVDVIVACGGDGTLNEVVNGFDLEADGAADRPAWAVLPAGGTNVLARALKIPNDPVRAAAWLVDALAQGRERTISIGSADERAFVFSAGLGVDAAVVRAVESKRTTRRPSDMAHAVSLAGIMAEERFRMKPKMDVVIDDTGENFRAATIMCGRQTPYTYIGRTAMNLLPNSRLEGSLDFIAPEHVGVGLTARTAVECWRLGRFSEVLGTKGKLNPHENVERFTAICDEPQPLQLDGEYVGDRTHVHFGTIRNCLRMIA